MRCRAADGRPGPVTRQHFRRAAVRSLKYECVYLRTWETGSDGKAGVAKWIEFYNRKRPHSALGGKPPAVVYWLRKDQTQPDHQEQRVA